MSAESQLQEAAYEIMVAGGFTPDSMLGRIVQARIAGLIQAKPAEAEALRQRLLTILAGNL